jgi:L-fuconolactonase
MQVIDAHCHFWNPARGDYGWLMDGPDTLEPLRRVFGPNDLAALNGAGQVVAVQAADSLGETQYLLGLAAQHHQIAGVVGWVDLTAARAADDIAALAQNPAFKGVRPMLQDIADSGWINTAPRADAIAALLQHGLRFDALVQTRHLRALATFAARWPNLPLVIDHCAKPVMGKSAMGGPLDADWCDGMAALAAQPQVMCKLSGLLTELPAQHPNPAAALRPVVDFVLRAFGPDRVMWGSDWPVLTLAASHRAWAEMTDDLLAGLPAPARAAIMGQTAARFYGIGHGAGESDVGESDMGGCDA